MFIAPSLCIVMPLYSNVITHCDITINVPSNIITHCDIITSVHCDVRFLLT